MDRRVVFAVGLATLLITACSPTGIVPVVGRAVTCADHPQRDQCEEAFDAVKAELADRIEVGQMRIDPVQCANGRCWTWAYVTPAGAGPEQQLSVDWGPTGEISVGYVVP